MIYIIYDEKFLGYDDDGVAIYSFNSCRACAKWEDGVLMAPKLIKNEKGFTICPNCSRPY